MIYKSVPGCYLHGSVLGGKIPSISCKMLLPANPVRHWQLPIMRREISLKLEENMFTRFLRQLLQFYSLVKFFWLVAWVGACSGALGYLQGKAEKGDFRVSSYWEKRLLPLIVRRSNPCGCLLQHKNYEAKAASEFFHQDNLQEVLRLLISFFVFLPAFFSFLISQPLTPIASLQNPPLCHFGQAEVTSCQHECQITFP